MTQLVPSLAGLSGGGEISNLNGAQAFDDTVPNIFANHASDDGNDWFGSDFS